MKRDRFEVLVISAGAFALLTLAAWAVLSRPERWQLVADGRTYGDFPSRAACLDGVPPQRRGHVDCGRK